MPHMKAILAAAVAGFMALTLAPSAFAQVTAEQQAAIKSSCRSDYMANCRGVKPGGIEALQCLQNNLAKLSPSCQGAVSATVPKPAAAAPSAPPPPAPAAQPVPVSAPAPSPASASAPAIVTAKPPPTTLATPKPAAPLPKVAAPAKPVPPPAPQQAAVAPPAVDAPPAATAAQMSAITNTCRGDFKRNCKGIAPGTAEAIACLQRHAARLSPNCKTSIADLGDSLPPPGTPAVTTQRPNAPVVMTAVIGRACLRDLVRRCRDTGVGDGQKIACLMAHEPELAPLCKAALKGTAPLR